MAWPSPSPMTAVAGQLMTAAIWNAQVRDALNVLKASLDDTGNIAPTTSALTIAAGGITPSLNRHTVDTESSASTDDLTTLAISGSTRDGHILVLSGVAPSSRVVTVRSGIGNMVLNGGDFALDAAYKLLVVQLVGTTWYELCRSVASGLNTSYTSVTANYTVGNGDGVIECNGTFTVTLTAASSYARRMFVVKNIGTGIITVAATSGNVEGGSSMTLDAGFSVTYWSDGTNWWAI